MNAFQEKITWRVLGVHAVVLFLMIVIPVLRGCLKPKPKEIVTFIEFGESAPQVSIEPVSKMTDPEPPAPEPAPSPIPEPAKPKRKAKATKPKKPKWKPVDPKDIKIGKKVSDSPKQPTISSEDIRRALKGVASSARATGNPSQFNNYYASVMRLFYTHWTPPATATLATGATIVRISMRKNGQITKRQKIKGSGDSLYDKIVMDAVNAVNAMPKPPLNYPFDYVEVSFTLDN